LGLAMQAAGGALLGLAGVFLASGNVPVGAGCIVAGVGLVAGARGCSIKGSGWICGGTWFEGRGVKIVKSEYIKSLSY